MYILRLSQHSTNPGIIRHHCHTPLLLWLCWYVGSEGPLSITQDAAEIKTAAMDRQQRSISNASQAVHSRPLQQLLASLLSKYTVGRGELIHVRSESCSIHTYSPYLFHFIPVCHYSMLHRKEAPQTTYTLSCTQIRANLKYWLTSTGYLILSNPLCSCRCAMAPTCTKYIYLAALFTAIP